MLFIYRFLSRQIANKVLDDEIGGKCSCTLSL